MRSYSFVAAVPLLQVVSASPITHLPISRSKVVARHIVDGRQIAHGSGLESAHTLASSTIYLEDSEGLALVSSQNFTTVIVESTSGSKTSTLIAAWGSQPIYSLGPSAGYILGIPEYIYAPFAFPDVDASKLPLQVCTFVYPEPSSFSTNFTISERDSFVVDTFASQLNLGDAITEFCVRVGQAPSSTSAASGGSQPSNAPASGSGSGDGSSTNSVPNVPSVGPSASPAPVSSQGNTGSNTDGHGASSAIAPSSVRSSDGPVASASQAPATSTPVIAPVPTSLSSSAVQPSSGTAPLASSIQSSASAGTSSTSDSVSAILSSLITNSFSASSSTLGNVSSSTVASVAPSTSSLAVVPSASGISSTSSASAIVTVSSSSASVASTMSATSASSSISASVLVNASTSASSVAPSVSASATSAGPNPAYQTTVSFAGKTYINKGLVGFGAIEGDAVDSYGETIGSLGSAVHLQSFQRDANGSFSGVMVTQPDRGHNTDTTTDYISRRHLISFKLNPYYGNTSLEYEAAKSSFPLKYESTVRYFEADKTPTTGLDPTTFRNGSIPQPIASQSYNHISSDPEGLVILADGSSWVSDEYGPYIWKYSAEGILLDTIVPPKAVLPYKNGTLYFSTENKDGPDTGRVPNQGFEGLTVSPDGNTLYAFMQSGLTQDLDSNDEGRYARMFIYDISGSPNLKHSYVVKLPVTNGKGKTLAQSDVLYLSEDALMLLSRDGKGNGNDDSESKHKDFMLFNFDGATDLVNTEYTDGVKPVSPKGVLDSSIVAAEPIEFIDIIDEIQLKRFGLHNAGDFDVSLINGKWESAAIASVQDPEYPNDYFLFSFSDNDFITTNGFEAGEKYVDGYGSTLDNQALVWRITLP
ncbi:hypothetical protein I203_104445 [Kwoniella mangroviensis CBS 8507]|uniref:uncharacterized protein n=1 Tax=Kwoniella mangroviensis CBS 8507 TaxID=1296122 RepID=UPI00080D61A3|nr:uncharacterized protein I203_00608 [Kwoniella mangroviensis CBS 8507]OCF70474.1 hypothetical protein I203_00608 [Kwoniella mangroviensis CBS 8507]